MNTGAHPLRFRRIAAVPFIAFAALAVGGAFAADPEADFAAAWRSALATDQIVASAQASRDAAAHAVSVAAGRLQPQVTLQATVQQSDQTTARSDAVTGFRGASRQATVQLRQTLYRPRDKLGLSIAELSADQADLRLKAAQADLFDRLATAWIDMAGARTRAVIAAATLVSAQSIEAQAAAALAGGEGTRDALAEAAAQTEVARADLKESELDYDSKRLIYRSISGLGTVAAVQIPMVDRAEAAFDLCAEASIQRIRDANPQLATARVEAQINRQREAQASADHKPTLDLVGSVTEGANDTTSTLGTQYRNGSIGVQLVLPLYTGGAATALQRQAASLVQAAEAAIGAVDQRLRLQIGAECAVIEGSQWRIRSTQRLVQAAHSQRRATQARVTAGVKSLGDLAGAEQALARRQTDWVRAQVSGLKSQIKLLTLLPGGDPAQLRWAQALQGWLVPSEPAR